MGGRSKSLKAGLVFPVARFLRYMKTSASFRRRRISTTAGVYVAAVLEYLTRELAELSVLATLKNNRKTLTPRSIMLAIANDEEFHKSLRTVMLPFSGVLPAISPALLPQKNSPKRSTTPSPRTRSGAVQSPRSPDSLRSAVTSRNANGVPAKRTKRSKPSPLAVLSEKLIASQIKLVVLRGSVTNIKGDVVINPTGNSPGFHGQVGHALIAAGGDDFLRAFNSDPHNCLPIGHLGASVTKAAGIGCPNVLHCNSPHFSPNDIDKSVADLTTVIRNCLKLCDEKQFAVLVMPSVGSGNAGYPKQLAAQTILRTIKEYCDMNAGSTSIRTTYFVLYDQASIDIYTTELGRL